MGRKTWEALPFALPGRRNIVITRQLDYPLTHTNNADVMVANSLSAACAMADALQLMIIGGAQLYSACLAWASVMELSLIDHACKADTWFPQWDLDDWHEVARQDHLADQNNAYAMSFVRFHRND